MGIRHRANGQGTAVKVKTNDWKAIVIVGYKDSEYKKPVRKCKSGFKTKSEALAYCSILLNDKLDKPKSITLLDAYNKWLPTHQASKSTIACYVAAFKIFESCYYYPINNIDIDMLQECVDDCPTGVRTKQNAKACLGLIYKWLIPRQYVDSNLNLATFLKVGENDMQHKSGFTLDQLNAIKNAVGTIPYADFIYCHCYLGFRPSELLALTYKDYNEKEKAFIGGSKTDAGKNRIVTVSPKIESIISLLVNHSNNGYIFGNNGKQIDIKIYRKGFYSCLEKLGIKNENHELTPHSCRHTFATLMKAIEANDKDKLELIGHASTEQLRYYQDVNLDDLRKITDKL